MVQNKQRKAVALISGGLDSTLAAMIVKKQGIQVYGLHFRHAFNTNITSPEYTSRLRLVMEQVGMPLRICELTDEITDLVIRHPHGYGKHLNPCIDCRILQLKLAKEYMEEIGADFILTGEVIGQRPMSQKKHTIKHIEKEAKAKGCVLRPLCAGMLEPTFAEQTGLVDRNKLYSIAGRSRKGQKKLAEELGLSDYPEAGGGCRLTYEGFSRKMKDLIDNKDPKKNDIFLLQAGRHFRTSKFGKVVVGKDEKDNQLLKDLALEGDKLFEVYDGKGPTVLLRDGDSELDIILAACLCVSHAKLDGEAFKLVRYWDHGSNRLSSRQVAPLEQEQIEKMRI